MGKSQQSQIEVKKYFRQPPANAESDHNEFLDFGDSMYSDASVMNMAAASRGPLSKTENSKPNDHIKRKRKYPKKIRLNWKRRRQDRQYKKRMSAEKMDSKFRKDLKVSTLNGKTKNSGPFKSINKNNLKSRYLTIYITNKQA